MSELEARAVWTSSPPAAGWCPNEWLPHLAAVAPGLHERRAAQPNGQADAHGVTLDAADWALVGTTRRGRLHAHRGEHGEDAHAITATAHGWCAAVADGAGSAPWSRLGSAIATFVVTETMRRTTGPSLRETMLHAATAAQQALTRFAELADIAPRTLRATLLAAVVHDGQLGVMHVGDGALVLLGRADGADEMAPVVATSLGHAGEYSGEVQHFLPDPGALEALHASYAEHAVRDVHAVLLASDGVEDAWYPMHRHAPTILRQLVDGAAAAAPPEGITLADTDGAAVFGAPDRAAALGEWLGFAKRGENDDRTLCAAVRRLA